MHLGPTDIDIVVHGAVSSSATIPKHRPATIYELVKRPIILPQRAVQPPRPHEMRGIFKGDSPLIGNYGAVSGTLVPMIPGLSKFNLDVQTGMFNKAAQSKILKYE